MGITNYLFDSPFYTGAPTSTEVPTFFEVAVNGKPYLIDWTTDQILRYTYRYRHETLPITRQQADNQTTPGEHSLSADGLWRRAMEDWRGGAGQTFFDRPDSQSNRFRVSKGIDPWTAWQFSLLNDTTQSKSDTNTNLKLAVAGARLYLAYGKKLAYTTDLASYTDVTGTDNSTLNGVASDGFHVYGAWTSGIGRTDTSTGAVTDAWNALVASGVWYVKDRLMAVGSGANSHIVYNVTASGAAPAALFTPLNTATTWAGFAEGQSCIYGLAVCGDKSLVYRFPIKSDGTGLDAAVVAGELPDGEAGTAIGSYLGFIVIGSALGWRFAVASSSNGDLTIGGLVMTPAPVRAFEPQDRFIWFGYTNYDSVSTGLGRMDLTVVNTGGTPAYASDLMVTNQGAVLDIATFLNKRVFTVSGLGVYAEDTTHLVSTGTIDSGFVTFGLPDEKIAVAVDIRHAAIDATDGSHSAWIALDGGAFASIGVHTAAHINGETFLGGKASGSTLELRHVLTRGSTVTHGPVIERATFKVAPRVSTVLQIQVPLILSDVIEVQQTSIQRDAIADYNELLALRSSQQIIQYQEYSNTWSVVIDNLFLFPGDYDQQGNQVLGTVVLQMKTLDV